MKHKILLDDDEPANLRMLERLFREEYDVLTSESGPEAMELLSYHEFALIISDQRMPGVTGIEFLKQAAAMRPQTVRIVLTGYTDVADLVDAINSGVIYKYITKPWLNVNLLQTVQRAIEHYETRRTHSSLALENERLKLRIETTVEGLVNMGREMVARKDPDLTEHCRRTSGYAALIGTRFNLEPGELKQLIHASLLHEVPNTGIPLETDLGKTALTAEQFEEGLGVISAVPDLENVATIIRYQHESFDGTGLFYGLDGEKIPFLSRILSVAHAYDEIDSGRNTTHFSSEGSAAHLLQRLAGNKLDPRIVDVCLKSRLFAAEHTLNVIGSSLFVPTVTAALRYNGRENE